MMQLSLFPSRITDIIEFRGVSFNLLLGSTLLELHRNIGLRFWRYNSNLKTTGNRLTCLHFSVPNVSNPTCIRQMSEVILLAIQNILVISNISTFLIDCQVLSSFCSHPPLLYFLLLFVAHRLVFQLFAMFLKYIQFSVLFYLH